jgi:hypothetical protein
MSEEKYGRIVQIIGPVIDVAFDDESHLPNLLDALEIERANGEKLITEVFQGLVVLDCEYGENRNCLESGGYSVILETEDDIQEFGKTLDIVTRPPEWATWIDNTGYISALYIINDDFSIMVYMRSEIIPTLIRKELYEE